MSPIASFNLVDHLTQLEANTPRALKLITDWSAINTHTENHAGIAQLACQVEEAFSSLKPKSERLELENPLDKGRPKLALRFTQKSPPSKPRARVLLGIHLDTVFPVDHSFQKPSLPKENVLMGPGVLDAKGGLVVLLLALESLQSSPYAKEIAWEVFLNSDEEIGSPSSGSQFMLAAQRNDVGMLFEPALPGGELVSQRKGSASFRVTVKGKSAHAGRDFHLGRSSLAAAVQIADALHGLNDPNPRPGAPLTVNVADFLSAGPLNVVPELTTFGFNTRFQTTGDYDRVEKLLVKLKKERRSGIDVDYSQIAFTPPKPVDAAAQFLMESFEIAARSIDIPLSWKPSGGVCDGNRLAFAGLPTIDTLGPRGNHLHTPEEFLFIDSIAERSKLAAAFLIMLGSGEIMKPRRIS